MTSRPSPRSTLARAALAGIVALAGTGSGCFCAAGSPGVLVGAGRDARFVTERATLWVQASDGVRSVALDGSGSRLVFRGSVSVQDVAPDFRKVVLSDSETNLLVGDVSTGSIVSVPQLAKRLSAAELSPDGTRIAATRHSDFSLPQERWVDDDAIFIVDVATLAVTTLPASSTAWPTRVQWSADGKALWLTMAFEKPSQWVTLADGARKSGLSAPPEALRPDPRARSKCTQTLEADRWKSELRITDEPGATPRVLARLEGRERGFHDYQPDFSNTILSPACRYALFHYDGRMWAVDVRGGSPGPVVAGDALFFVPDAVVAR